MNTEELPTDQYDLLRDAKQSLRRRWEQWNSNGRPDPPPRVVEVFEDHQLNALPADTRQKILEELLKCDLELRDQHKAPRPRLDEWRVDFPDFQQLVEKVLIPPTLAPRPATGPSDDQAQLQSFMVRIGRYHKRRRISKGGFSEVWEGFDTELNTVALKILNPPTNESKAKWVLDALHEAIHQNRFQESPHVVTVLDVWPSLGQADTAEDLLATIDPNRPPTIVMELMPRSLKDLLNSGELQGDYVRCASIAAATARGLSELHRASVVHRDLKPGNILLDKNDSPKISDFGLAAFDKQPALRFAGTLPYASPEQYQGAAIDARSDIYSLGVVLYEMLNDEKPFEVDGDDWSAWKEVICHQPPSAFHPQTPPKLEEICRKCLQKDPGDRYQRAADLADELEGWIDDQKHDPQKYLRTLSENCCQIELRGFRTREVLNIPIERLYIPLTMMGPDREGFSPSAQSLKDKLAGDRRIKLEEALKHRRLVIIGDPGQGKTTFLRLVAFQETRFWLGGGPSREQGEGKPFPVLISISALCRHIQESGKQDRGLTSDDSPQWLANYLAAQSAEQKWGLIRESFEKRLDGSAIVLLDGLDEAPDDRQRANIASLVQRAASTYENARFVVTSRPAAYEGEAVLQDFAHARIKPLDDDDIHDFLQRWCGTLHAREQAKARTHFQELTRALFARADIMRIARNPVMLTALAIVHYNENRIPEQRAELYEAIIEWLAKSRQARPGRLPWQQCRSRLQELALFMQTHPDGRQKQIPRRIGAEAIASAFRTEEDASRGKAIGRNEITSAEEFLREEELDSGIIVGRGEMVQFWHLMFQEFLAARELSELTDAGQSEQLFQQPQKLFSNEWREVVLLLAGKLSKPKVDRMFREILHNYEPGASSLSETARFAGLLGIVVRDLAPLSYEPPADCGYRELLDRVNEIFDAKKSRAIPIKVRIEAADALGQAGDPRFLETHWKENFVTIPAGSFFMKSIQRQVELDKFQIGRYPVTVGEYSRFVEDGAYQQQRWWSQGGFGEFREPEIWDDQSQYPTRPVVGVNWFEASAYASWLGDRHFPRGLTCCLLSEAQWERAAGGVDGREFAWGDGPVDESRLNFAPDFKPNVGHPTPVGHYPHGATPDDQPNKIYDLSGNVWEWVIDWWHEKPLGGRNPVAVEKKEAALRVLRGGGWNGPAGDCRVALRHWCLPQYRFDGIGFRLATVRTELKQGAEWNTRADEAEVVC